MALKYIDISVHNGNIDFAKLAKEVDGVIIRAGYGRNNIDKLFHTNAKGCRDNGIHFGVYWFSYALTAEDARQEALYCLEAIKPYKVELPVCFDLEYDTRRYANQQGVNITRALASEMVKAFCETVEAAGYFAMNYANEDYCKNYFTAEVLQRFALWYARYTDNVTGQPRSCGIWQHTSKGTVAGIAGNVDVNKAFYDYKAIIENKGLNNLKAEPEQQAQAWYADAQAWAIAQGITDGSRPTDAATRAEVWAMLQRMDGGE